MPLNSKRTNGFLCYAHLDGKSPSRKFVEELETHQKQECRELGHRVWSDQSIRPGDDWPAEIRKAIEYQRLRRPGSWHPSWDGLYSSPLMELKVHVEHDLTPDDARLRIPPRGGIFPAAPAPARASAAALRGNSRQITPAGAESTRQPQSREASAVVSRCGVSIDARAIT